MESSVEHERLMPILQEALDRQPEEREAFVRAACNGDQELHRELVEALQWEERMGTFLLTPLMDLAVLLRPFQPGEVVAQRFEILREIGEGGMGVVYEAFDGKRQQRIAIKAAKPGFQRLLSPELKAALTVRHHNICLVNEIHTTQTEGGETDFLTMEFLEGETLSAHLAEHGKLPHEEALDIACQLCAGLAEAHHSGIIHRDLKSGNVILCRNEDGSRRAVITDFGLAGGLGLPSGGMAGTPGYMAPELWDGSKAEKLSDIYALGVILHEMVTGRKPSVKRPQPKEGEAKDVPSTWPLARQGGDGEAADVAAARSTWIGEEEWQKREVARRPVPPSTWTHHLDPRWDRAVVGCLEPLPADRTQDITEVLERLRREPIRKTPFMVAALLVLALSGGVTLVRPVRQRVSEFIWPPNVRLVVLPYDGPKDLAAVGGGALQEVADRVQQLPTGRRSVSVIPPSRAARLQVETPQQARDVLHATHALKVSLQHEGEDLSARVSLLDLNSQLPIKELSARYPQSNLAAIPAALTGLVALALRLPEKSAEAALAPAATGAYLKGVYFLNRDIHSFDEAIVQFQEAARLDPNSPLPAAGTALALVQKFNSTKQNVYLGQARDYLRAAQSSNPDSVRVLIASGRINEATSQYHRAFQDYRRIQELEPRNVDAMLGMATVHERLGEPEEAEAAFRKAQELDPEYYRSYQALGDFYYRHGRDIEAAEQFRSAIARAPGFFDAYSSLAVPLMDLGRYDEAEAALQSSLKIRETAQGLNNMGALLSHQWRFEEAAAYQKRALAYDPNNYIWWFNLGDNIRWAGHPAEARPYYTKAREQTKAEMTLNPQSARPRAYFAYVSAVLGDKARAEEEISQAVRFAPGDNDVLRRAVLIYELLGERNLAIESLRGLTLAELRELTRYPDLAEFCQDPRFKQQMIDKGGQ